MNALTPFTFPATGQQVRTLTRDDEPWFLANDVCSVLEIANVGNVLARLDDDEKDSIRLVDGNRGNPNKAVISEPGLYAVILRSDSHKAKPFRRWVTHDVLPVIRKTGSYAATSEPPDELELAERNVALIKEKRALAAKVAELEPVADAWIRLADAQGDYSLREAAQVLDRDPAISTGQNRLARYLRTIGWTASDGQPYQRHIDAGRLVRRSLTYALRRPR